jgi:predicted nucleotidyltransferase
MFYKMRLSSQTRQTIKATVQEVFGVAAEVKLFGSRVNDEARGGDIDLLIELPFVAAEVEHKIIKLIARLQLRIGDQPIDVLVIDPLTRRLSIHEHAVLTGIKL